MFHTFAKDICPKVNVIAQLEVKPACFDVAIQQVSHSISENLLTISRYIIIYRIYVIINWK